MTKALISGRQRRPLIQQAPARKSWLRNPLSNPWFFGFIAASLWLASGICWWLATRGSN